MISSGVRRRLEGAYKIIDPRLTHLFQRRRDHKSIESLQVTGDVDHYINTNADANYLSLLEGFVDAKDFVLQIPEFIMFIKSVNVILSNKVSSLWNIRESNSNSKLSVTSARFITVGLLSREMKAVLKLYQRLRTTAYSNSRKASTDAPFGWRNQLAGLFLLLNHSITMIIPSLLTRLDNFVRQSVRDSTTESTRQFCSSHPRDFLVLQRTHSRVLHTLYSVLGVQSTHIKKKRQSEVELCALLREQSVHPLYASIARTCDADTTRHFTAIALNATLEFFLQYLVVHEEKFDEPGVYQLFRVILKLQEYVAELKRELNITASHKLVQDSSIWHKAECIVQTLNSAVFAVVLKSVKHATIGSTASDNNSSTTHYLTEAEESAWKALVGTQGRRLTLRRQRHKGTVFVTLELDLSNL